VGADKRYEDERDYPYKQVQYMQSLLQGLPIEAMSRDIIEPSEMSNWLSDLGLFGGTAATAWGTSDEPGWLRALLRID
jgi:hypothetical protein